MELSYRTDLTKIINSNEQSNKKDQVFMKLKQLFLYTLIFFTALIVFSVLLFPKNKFAVYLSQSAENYIPAIKVNYKEIVPKVPFGIKFKNLNIIFSNETQCKINALNFQFEPKSLPKTILQFIDQSDADKDFISGSIHIKTLSLNSDTSMFKQLNLQAIDFSDIEFEFTHKSNTLAIIKGKAIGSLISMELIGKINLASPLQTSKLNLTCKILPDSPYLKNLSSFTGILSSETDPIKDGISFKISGTLKNPKLKI